MDVEFDELERLGPRRLAVIAEQITAGVREIARSRRVRARTGLWQYDYGTYIE
jgi:hypothetical protein